MILVRDFSYIWGLVFACCATLNSFAEELSESEITKANTAIDVSYLSAEEKEVIKYVNLVRMYPKKFCRLEVLSINANLGSPLLRRYRSSYGKSLVKELKAMKPLDPLVLSPSLYVDAKCFAKEQGETGEIGHKREKCVPRKNEAECCHYGSDNGLEIVLSMLIDYNVPSLGHRRNLLDARYKRIGVAIGRHVRYVHCCVIGQK